MPRRVIAFLDIEEAFSVITNCSNPKDGFVILVVVSLEEEEQNKL